jgi:hypothetical protein
MPAWGEPSPEGEPTLPLMLHTGSLAVAGDAERSSLLLTQSIQKQPDSAAGLLLTHSLTHALPYSFSQPKPQLPVMSSIIYTVGAFAFFASAAQAAPIQTGDFTTVAQAIPSPDDLGGNSTLPSFISAGNNVISSSASPGEQSLVLRL